MANFFGFAAFICLFLVNISHGVDPQPEQIHLAGTGDPTEMVVTWVTLVPTNHTIVEYNKRGLSLDYQVMGKMTTFVDGGSAKRKIYIHRATLTGLIPGEQYEYHCGGIDGWSSIFYFTALRNGTEWKPRMALYGDLGSTNARSLSYLQQETQRGHFDLILHVGDFAYDMATENAEVGDDFMRQIEPIAAYLPYMTCPGNHEYAYNFSNYRNRFSMPGNTDNMYYSFNVGPLHIISISTEFYFFLEYGLEQLVLQYEWLEKDLQEAASFENRTKRPWIIVMGHRPMYCSNSDGDDCTKHESIVRAGLTSKHLFGLEDLLYKYGVDLNIWAHEHSYERLLPLYNFQVCNGSRDEPYTNPCAPVHIITGSGGCHEDHDPFRHDYGPWTAFRSEDYGYSRLTVHNRTHLFIDYVSTSQGGKVIDKMWLVKDVHGPEAWVPTA